MTGTWTHVTVRTADLSDANTFRPGDILGGFYIQVLGGSGPKFYMDNVQFTRPRTKK